MKEKPMAIVSPEAFERFKRGEMTREELLEIKKAVDKVTEAKLKCEEGNKAEWDK